MKENRKVFLSFFTVFPVKSVVKERFSFWNRRTIFLSLSLSLPISLFVCVSLSLSLSLSLSVFVSLSPFLTFSLSLFLSLSLFSIRSAENVVQQRPYNFCVVDEADSILIDEVSEVKWRVQTGEIGYDKYKDRYGDR